MSIVRIAATHDPVLPNGVTLLSVDSLAVKS